MTLRGTVQVNSEAIGAIAVPQNRSLLVLYLPTTTTTKNFFRTGHEKQEFSFSKSTPFYVTEQT